MKTTRRGPRSPEGIAAVTSTIQRVNAERRNVRRAPPERHGVYAMNLAQPETQALTQHILDILAGDNLGHIRPSDRVTAELLAITLRRVRQCEAYLDRHGLTGAKGALRPVAQLLTRLLAEARAFCEALAMTPAARAKLGLDTGRAFSLAQALAAMTQGRDGMPDAPETGEVANVTGAARWGNAEVPPPLEKRAGGD